MGEGAEATEPRRISSVPPAGLRLVVLGNERITTVRLPVAGEVTLGRSPSCFVRIDDRSVGERHAAIRVGSPLTLIDLGSGHRTTVGSERLAPGAAVPMSPGAIVLLGNVALRAGKKIEWDAKNLKVKNAPEVERHLRREYRKGWSL